MAASQPPGPAGRARWRSASRPRIRPRRLRAAAPRGRVESRDRRSALRRRLGAGGRSTASLLALTNSGSVIRFPKPGSPATALIHDLADGPGIGRFKRNRDSEALARDPAGRGWWVAFEKRHQLWLYDPDFRRVLRGSTSAATAGARNSRHRGDDRRRRGLMLFPEAGHEWLEPRAAPAPDNRLTSRFGHISDAVPIARRPAAAGRRARPPWLGSPSAWSSVERAGRDSSGFVRSPGSARRARQCRGDRRRAARGGTRLWLMTDNNFRPRAPTYWSRSMRWP